jgi:hypothetical protein
VSTRHEASSDSREGLLYYLPKQDIILTVTVAKENAAGGGGQEPKPGRTSSAAGDGGAGGGQSENDGGEEESGDQDKKKPSTPAPQPTSTNPSFSGTSGQYTVHVTTTPPYPDLSQPYWLSFGTNWLGKNSMDISISTTGLLQSSKSATEPGISDALIALARAAALPRALTSKSPEKDRCAEGVAGTYVYRIAVLKQVAQGEAAQGQVAPLYCGFSVKLEAIGEANNMPDEHFPDKQEHGVYYRQAIPYIVTVDRNDMHAAGILSSPSQSGRYFLPVKSTLFAKNSAEFGFKDGMPTLYKQEADGEVVGFLKLPADIIGAYFGAVGELFTSLLNEPAGEAALIQAQTDLELVRFRQERCLAAIGENDPDAIAATCSAASGGDDK